MAEVAAGFVGPAIEVVKWVAAPILRQFNYLCCFTTNIANLKNEAQKLQDTEQDLQGKVDAARNDVRLISGEVETWLQNSKNINDEKNGIIDETSQAARVQKLHARLSGPKRILLVLDDVWERFQPEDLGLPCNHKGCTILLTSHNRDVLSAMNVEKIFGMEVLSKEDSWLLFRMGAGQCVANIYEVQIRQ